MTDDGKRNETILTIADHEATLVRRNMAVGGEYADFCDRAVNYLASLVATQTRKSFVFTANYAVLRNAAILAMLSVLRQHRVQSSINLRTAIEHTSIAVFALSADGLAIAERMVEDHDLPDEDELRKRAYRWIAESYPTESKVLHDAKSEINRWESHAGLMGTFPVFDWSSIEGDSFQTNFFNSPDLDHLRVGLWRVGFVALQIAATIGRVGRDLGNVTFGDDGKELQELFKIGDKRHQEIMASGRFKSETEG